MVGKRKKERGDRRSRHYHQKVEVLTSMWQVLCACCLPGNLGSSERRMAPQAQIAALVGGQIRGEWALRHSVQNPGQGHGGDCGGRLDWQSKARGRQKRVDGAGRVSDRNRGQATAGAGEGEEMVRQDTD